MVFNNNCIFRSRIFVSNILLNVMLCTTMKPNGKLCMGLTNIERIEGLECICLYWSCISVVWLFTFILYSTLHSLQVEKSGNVTVKNYLKESLSSILCFIIHRKGSSEKGLILPIPCPRTVWERILKCKYEFILKRSVWALLLLLVHCVILQKLFFWQMMTWRVGTSVLGVIQRYHMVKSNRIQTTFSCLNTR